MLLDSALAQTGSAIGHVRADQSALPTPCPSFDVRTLVNHTVFDIQMFTSMIDGGERGSPDADLIGQDWSAAFTRASERLRAAWQARGIDGTIENQLGELPASWAAMQHAADLAVHSWDIAVATGQSTDTFDTVLAEASLAWAKGALKPEFRGADKSFGTEVTVPESAPAYDRLVAFFGREPRHRTTA